MAVRECPPGSWIDPSIPYTRSIGLSEDFAGFALPYESMLVFEEIFGSRPHVWWCEQLRVGTGRTVVLHLPLFGRMDVFVFGPLAVCHPSLGLLVSIIFFHTSFILPNTSYRYGSPRTADSKHVQQ